MGYLFVDHRASPGLPEDIARQAGYDPRLCREGKMFEVDTMTCSICRGVVIPHPLRTRERNACKVTGHYICDGCAYLQSLPDYVYVPFEKVVEDIKKQTIIMGSPDTLTNKE